MTTFRSRSRFAARRVRTFSLAATLLGSAGILAPAASAEAPQGFDLSANMRLRYEAIDGQARPGFDSRDSLVELRTIITAQYTSGPFKLFGELFDSRAWLADRGTPLSTGEVNAFEPVQAYAALSLPEAFGKGSMLAFQAGRFTLDLGSRRLLANDDFRNTTNGFTGIRVDASGKNGLHATAIYVLPQQRRPDDPDGLRDNRVHIDREGFDQVMWGGLIGQQHAIGPVAAEISFYHFGEHDRPGRPTRDRSLNTIGARIIRDPKPGAFDYELEGMLQRGQINSSLAALAPRQTVRASFAHADLGYSFTGSWKPHLVAEFDYTSGDGPGNAYARFDTLFGMRRADFSPAGLFNAVHRANILTPGLRIEVAPNKRTDGFFSYRPMWLAARTDAFSTTGVRDATGRSGRFAGHQFDARVRYWLVPTRLRFEANGTWLAKGRFLHDAPNAPANGDTKYVAVNVTAFL